MLKSTNRYDSMKNGTIHINSWAISNLHFYVRFMKHFFITTLVFYSI